MPEKNAQPTSWGRWRWKRTVVMALVLLVGGAVVNVAVAWGFTSQYDEPPVRAGDSFALYVDDHFALMAAVQDLRGVTLTRTYWWLNNAWASPPMPDYEHVISYSKQSADFVLSELARFGPEFARSNWGCEFQIVSAGWPTRSMRLGIACATTASALVVRIPIGDVRLPVEPILPGFIINTVFYALLLWLLFLAPFAAQRMIRRRRGQCERCAYPVGASPVCTKCGAAVRVSRPASD